MATRAREELQAALRQGDATTARRIIDRIRQMLTGGPETAELAADLANLASTEKYLLLGEYGPSTKLAHYQSERRKQGQRSPPPQST